MKALRSPRTGEELRVRKKYERVMKILWKRYNYGMEEKKQEISDDMEEYRWGDFRDEIATVNLRRT